MKQVLIISDSYDQVGFDVKSDIRTVMSLGHVSSAVVPSTHDENYNYDSGEALDLVLEDGMPDAVKLGYLPDVNAIEAISGRLAFLNLQNVVLVPSIISIDGSVLMSEDAYNNIVSKLMPLTTLIILNSMEAELISGLEFQYPSDIMRAAKMIFAQYGFAVLISGNELSGGKGFLYDGKRSYWRDAVTQCEDFRSGKYSVSSLICCGLADGMEIEEAVTMAEDYLSGRKQLVDPFTNPRPVQESTQEVNNEEVKEPVELVSPAKSLRDLARAFETPDAEKSEPAAVTSAIEAPPPGPKSEISELIKPAEAETDSNDLTMKRLQEMREKLSRMTSGQD